MLKKEAIKLNIDANLVIQKLSAQVATQAQQIAILQARVEQLQAENEELKSEKKDRDAD